MEKGTGLSNFFGLFKKQKEENVTEEDIISVVNEGHENGVLQASEAEMINNIVEFGDKEAKDIMTHRNNIVAIDGDMKLCEVTEFILAQSNSRFPVYQENIDNIIGIINFKDIMIFSSKKIFNDKKIKDIEGLVRAAIFIPETKKINLLFKMMQSQKRHMAIVVDEYGQTAGIVAMEDILEEIVGNILDEYDTEDADIIKKEDGTFLVKVTALIDDIVRATGIVFDGECETLNGYLTYKLERVLSNDERPELVINNVKYQVLNVEKRVITLVQITLLSQSSENESDK